MKNKIFMNTLPKYQNQIFCDLKSDIKKNFVTKHVSQSTAGFTLIEMLVVLIIIGVLSALVAPRWLAFTNRQQVNKVNDLVLSALQEAQSEAKKTKLNYSVWFSQKNANTPGYQYAIVSADVTAASNINIWNSLGGDVGAGSTFLMFTNITGENTATGTASNAITTTATKYITFDNTGSLTNPSFGTSGLKIVVAVPKTPNSTQAGNTQRCVVIQTILGGMQTAKDTNCS